MPYNPEYKKKAEQIGEFLGLLTKIASDEESTKKSRWPYEQRRRIENLNRVINRSPYPGKTSPRIERLIHKPSSDGYLFSAGRAKKILSKLAFEKQALFGRKKQPSLPPKPGLIQRVLSLPGKHPKATLFLGGSALGYWLGRRSKSNGEQNPVYQDTYQQYET